MARHYKQSRNDRLDESLGERRGRESSKKQSYKSRRDESRGASMHMPRDHARGEDGTQMYHEGKGYYGEGYGHFANLPPREEMRPYPDPYANMVESDYPDTLREIDRDIHDNYSNIERQRSDSMY